MVDGRSMTTVLGNVPEISPSVVVVVEGIIDVVVVGGVVGRVEGGRTDGGGVAVVLLD